MYILTSMGRAARLRAVADTYQWGGESQVILALYAGDKQLPLYVEQEWPENWRIETVPMLGNGPTYNEILKRHPNEKCYGFLADDAILDVQGMLRMLEADAGHWNVAYANDKHHGAAIPTMPCMGGDLVRAIGYLSPDCLIHWGIDCAWFEIGKRLGGLRYRADLTYTHLNPVWGTAPDDRTYQLARQNSFGYQDLFRAWMLGGELDAAVKRVQIAKRMAA
jgi:hypothetical protein